MAYSSKRGTKGRGSRGGYSPRKSTRNTGSGRKSTSGKRGKSAGQTVRLVIEHVQAQPQPLSQFAEAVSAPKRSLF